MLAGIAAKLVSVATVLFSSASVYTMCRGGQDAKDSCQVEKRESQS